MAGDPKLKVYPEWALARLANGEEPRDVSAFVAHLKAIGADWTSPHLYGLPYLAVVPKAG